MKTPAGRARKIAEIVATLARGETIVPQTGKAPKPAQASKAPKPRQRTKPA